MKLRHFFFQSYNIFHWFTEILDRFIPDHLKENDIEKLNQARFSLGPPFITAILSFVYCLFYLSVGDVKTFLIVLAPTISVPFVLTIFRRTGNVPLTSSFMGISFITALFLMSFDMGGLASPPLAWLLIIPIMMAGAQGRIPALFWMLICISVYVFFYFTYGYDFIHNNYQGESYATLSVLSFIGLIVLIFCFAILYDVFKDYAVDRIAESESVFRNLYETSLVGLWQVSLPEGRFIKANQATANILGYSDPESLIKGCTPYKLLSRKSNIDFMKRITRYRSVNNLDLALTLEDGRRIIVTVSTIFYPDKDYFEGSLIDITERKKNESDLKKANEDLETEIFKRAEMQELAHNLNVLKENLLAPANLEKRLHLVTQGIIDNFNASFSGIWVFREGDQCDTCIHKDNAKNKDICTEKGSCLHLMACTGAFPRISGDNLKRIPIGSYSESSPLPEDIKTETGKEFFSILQPQNTKEILSIFNLVSSDQSTIGILATFNASPISHYQNVQLEGLANAASNIIQIKIAEDKLKETRKQLIESERMSALGNLVAGVSHEISTPIGIGVTASSFIEDTLVHIRNMVGNEDIRVSEIKPQINKIIESSSMIQKNLGRASELITSFKQVAVDQSYESKRKFRLKDFFDDLLTSLHYLYKRTNHKIAITCPEEFEIESYPGVFSQILTNFIMNSLIHGFKDISDGKICINVEKNGTHLLLKYTDTGNGMDEKTLNNIFDPFFTTNREKGGTGLGMTIVYNLVTQKLMGQISCASTLGQGSEFIIKIPVTRGFMSQC